MCFCSFVFRNRGALSLFLDLYNLKDFLGPQDWVHLNLGTLGPQNFSKVSPTSLYIYQSHFRKTRNDLGSQRRESSKSFYEKQKLLLGKNSMDDKTRTKRSSTKSNVPVSNQRYTLNKIHSGSLNSIKNLNDEKGEKRKLKINSKLSNGRKIRSNENLNNIQAGKKGKIGRQKTLSQDSLFSLKQTNEQGAMWNLESSMEKSSSNSDLEDDGDSSDFEDMLSR